MELVGTLSLEDLSLDGTLSRPDELSGSIDRAANAAGTISSSFYRGWSAYEVAVHNGYTGTEEEWLAGLTADDATSEIPGIMKLYDEEGENTDGAMTQRSVTHAIRDHQPDAISADDLLEILI